MRAGLGLPLGLVLAACGPRPPAGAPDILLLTVDTLRADTLDHSVVHELTARGTHFPEASTPLPRTTPALASLHTGLLPGGHGSWEVGERVQQGRLLAEDLAAAGYRTLAVSGSRVAGPRQGLDAGFEDFRVRNDPRAGRAADLALELLPGWRPGPLRRPIFLWVHLTDPHFPYLPEAGPEAPLCRSLGEAADRKEIDRAAVFSDRGGRSSAALDDCRLLYPSEAAASFEALGRMVEALHDPVVVLTSDHGEALGDWGLFYEHGPDVSAANVGVPLVLAGPGVPEGLVDPRLGQLQDLRPTILRLAGLEVPEGIDGVDLFEDPPRDVATAVSASALHPELPGYLRSGRAGKRSCTNVAPWALCTDGLFHAWDDPEHERDLSAARPDVVAELEAVAARWPVERARQLAVWDAEHKLVAHPSPEGGYRLEVRLRDADETVVAPDAPVHAEVITRLGPHLPAPPEGAPAPPASDQEEEALRELGYLE